MPQIHLVACGAADQEGSDQFRSIAITSLPCVLGRASGCQYRINHPMISRRHCALSFRDGQVWIEDLASLNGTRIDGEPVQVPRPLVDGATLQLAHFTFVVRHEDSPAESGLRPKNLGSPTFCIAKGGMA
jgi:pSer/pThr/pTyr-binding forkhead associated (FHA) protein